MEILFSDDSNAIREYLSNGGFKHIDEYGQLGLTPLHHACRENRCDVIDVLIEFNADINLPAECLRETPLHSASSRGLSDIVGRLLKAGFIDIF